jgi:glycosyltransferase involved in cell wall biosynthesis
MKNLTLVIPAKKEKESLPSVLEELKNYELKIMVVLEKDDIETIEAIKKFNCEILYQENKGYGDALIQGINNVKTNMFCIFNADGSFNPKELFEMYNKIDKENLDLVFASRYEKDCSSEDDTWITFFGNFIFSKIGNIFFNLNISDILYTYVIGKTLSTQKLNLKKKDFTFCVELPIKAKRNNLQITTSKSNERARIAGRKKVNAIKDGFLILIAMINLFFNKNN